MKKTDKKIELLIKECPNYRYWEDYARTCLLMFIDDSYSDEEKFDAIGGYQLAIEVLKNLYDIDDAIIEETVEQHLDDLLKECGLK